MKGPMRIETRNQLSSTPGELMGKRTNGIESGFADALSRAKAQGIHFSKHAQKRLIKREINLTDQSFSRLINAVEKVEKRGGKESLVLFRDIAFIVDIAERKVVTALDVNQRGEGVFTQIDSVVLVDDDE